MNENGASVYKKMAAVMGELSRIPKNGYNREQNYQYVTSEDVKQAIRTAMAKHNLALLFELGDYGVEEVVSARGSRGTKVRGRLLFTLACGDTGQTVTRPIVAEAVDWQDKAFNKLYTTGEKYFLLSTFLVSTGDEDDADAGEDKPVKVEKPAQQAQPKPENGHGKMDWQSFFTRVQERTGGYYQHEKHLENFLGGRPDFTDKAAVKAAGEKAIAHACEQATAAKTEAA